MCASICLSIHSEAFTQALLPGADLEEVSARRIQAHLAIKDPYSAVEEARQALALYPQSSPVHEGYIRSLAQAGEEKKLVLAWEDYVNRFPDKSLNRGLIEEMAWGILQKASSSSSIVMRDMALLAAFFSQDAKGVAILHRGMQDSNYAVRAVAVKFSGHFRDHRLIQEVKRLFFEEKVWLVRQEVLRAVGKMKIIEIKESLEGLVASEESTAAEKALAIAALLELLDKANRVELEALALSNRAGLRQLACEAIAYFDSARDLDLLLQLAKDPHPDVRLEAFQSLGKLKPHRKEEQIQALAREGLREANWRTALSAGWLLTLYSPKEGQQALERFLFDERREVRAYAATAAAAAGSYGIMLTLDQFRNHPDPFVRLNLALGLIGQRQATQEAASYIKQMLMTEKSKWCRVKMGHFEAIQNKSAIRTEENQSDGEGEHQLIRLELLNLLAVLKTPEIEEAIRNYLNERSWEISATAAVLLLSEGDESAGQAVELLLGDSLPRIRLQAALILSLWSRDESAIQILEEGFQSSEWEMKARILEGLGRIGSARSIPFLIQVLKEPSQSLRLIAAMALIQCLNH